MADHTPTPWEDGTNHNGDPKWIFASGAVVADCDFFSDDAINRANVAFILKAVNNHKALVAELHRLHEIYGHQQTADVLAAVGTVGTKHD